MQLTGWKEHELEGDHLYADWFFTLDGDQASNWSLKDAIDDKAVENFFGDGIKPRLGSNSEALVKAKELYGGIVVPHFMRNEQFDKGSSWKLSNDEIPHLPSDAVIVGVIDTGIALGHRSTRLADGTTRFLAAWQQSADRRALTSSELQKQSHLPFGRELFAKDIDRMLDKHSIGGDKTGWLDEESFNRAAGLVDFRNVHGHRELALRAAHGTHVLDRAVGYDPGRDPELAEKIRIIAINLPNREIVGLSGSFLELYVLLGISRIVEISEAIADRARNGSGDLPKSGHYPLIINLSFGKQAGPRDGESAPIQRVIRGINQDANSYIDKGHVYMTMPAGNDNLLRSHAVVSLPEAGTKALQWRVLPEDQSSNYVEIWSDEIDEDETANSSIPLQVSVDLPNGAALDAPRSEKLSELKENVFATEIKGVVRLYCKVHCLENSKKYRVQYLICTAPTLSQNNQASTAPAGLWRIKLENTHSTEMTVFAHVQTDQSAMPDGVTGLRSHFEDDTYLRFDETTGRAIDAYPYPDSEQSIRERAKLGKDYPGNDKRQSVIKRHGTLNAFGIHKGSTIVTAGYRATDGAPADYSASGGAWVVKRVGDQQGAPTLALVTDDGAAHPGILSAGARDGSAVAMRGTSFAAPQITRKIAELLADGETDFNPKEWIRKEAESADGIIKENEDRLPPPLDVKLIGEANVDRWRKTDIEKTGRGRYPQSHYRGLNRLGAEEKDD